MPQLSNLGLGLLDLVVKLLTLVTLLPVLGCAIEVDLASYNGSSSLLLRRFCFALAAATVSDGGLVNQIQLHVLLLLQCLFSWISEVVRRFIRRR